MIDGSKKRDRQLAFELQIRMFVKSAVNCLRMTLVGASGPPTVYHVPCQPITWFEYQPLFGKRARALNFSARKSNLTNHQ